MGRPLLGERGVQSASGMVLMEGHPTFCAPIQNWSRVPVPGLGAPGSRVVLLGLALPRRPATPVVFGSPTRMVERELLPVDPGVENLVVVFLPCLTWITGTRLLTMLKELIMVMTFLISGSIDS